jgi:arabinosyltransferase
MLKDLSEEEFGPHVDFREYSFFENPSLPKQVVSCIFAVVSTLGLSCFCAWF